MSALSVLLVDDDQHTQSIFEMVLRHHAMELDVCDDAESALEYLQTHAPDVIVLDIMLPGIDGFQALGHIRTRALARNASVIATTAYHNADTQQDVLQRGFNGYLPKPLQPSTLADDLMKFTNRI
jgi:CheY-like chemotaxis protein